MFGYASIILFLVPVGVLCWRIVVSQTRKPWLRAGAAAAVMATLVGAAVVYDELEDFHFKDWRADIGLLAAMSGSFYLILWSLRKRSNRRHRTISIIAAIIGFVPIIGAVTTSFLFGELGR
jgi:hypothetical protein